MRRRQVRPVAAPGGVPWNLALGRCVEVWSDEDDRPAGMTDADWKLWRAYPTRRHYSMAFHAYVATLRLPRGFHWSLLPDLLRRANGRPWSFHDLERHDPERLAEKLVNAGLPSTWRPS